MSRLLSLLLLTAVTVGAIPQSSSAKCMFRWLHVTPAAKTTQLPRNLRLFFVYFGYGGTFSGLTLVSGADRVPLTPTRPAVSTGSFRNRYLVLTPIRLLLPNRTYRLVVEPSAQIDSALRRRLAAYTLSTGPQIDRTPPLAPQRVSSAGYELVQLGCGPSSQIPLTVHGVSDPRSPVKQVLYRFDVRYQNGATTRKLTLLSPTLAYKPNDTYIGHGMCSGNLRTLGPGRYTIRVSVIDLAGNVGPASAPITVDVPRR